MTDSQNSLPGDRNVWLTSFYGFSPENWGCINFTREGDRSNFIKESKPGDLVAIYMTGKMLHGEASVDPCGKVLGVYEINHTCGDKWKYIHPCHKEWMNKEGIADYRWRYAVQATRAWKIVQPIHVKELFPNTYKNNNPQFIIGPRGAKVTPDEADRLLQLKVQEQPVYRYIDPTTEQTLEQALG